MKTVASIVYKPKDAPARESAYTRVPLCEAQLVAGYGIEGDAKGGSPERHLNIMSAETLAEMEAQGFHTAPGEMGEQLIVAGFRVEEVPEGARLRIGETACVELIKPRTGCNRFESYQGKPAALAAGRIGMMAKVVEGGLIRVGDPVTVVTEQPG